MVKISEESTASFLRRSSEGRSSAGARPSESYHTYRVYTVYDLPPAPQPAVSPPRHFARKRLDAGYFSAVFSVADYLCGRIMREVGSGQ